MRHAASLPPRRPVVHARFAFALAFELVFAALAPGDAGLAAAAPAAVEGEAPPLAERYRDAAGRLIGAALLGTTGHERLGILCDRFGHRLSGTPQLEAAGAWARQLMQADGFANVRAEPVTVPVWSRGAERATLVAPVRHDLSMLGLGMSVGTPEGGIEADVVVVSSFDELEALGALKVGGKGVLFDVPFTSYGETVRFRSAGPSRAAKLGAVFALVRSVGPKSLDTPHTGALRYADGVTRIPAAALSVEHAAQLRRMAERGDTPRVRLEMAARMLEDAPSANVVAEIVGSELPEEVVLLGGHLDSWDVGQGAQDDGAGCLIAWEAARLIRAVGLAPRRTIRVVLFTNEENGLAGAKAYAERHAAAMANHVAVIESDSGNGLASGFQFQAPKVRAPQLPSGARARAAAEKALAERQASVEKQGLARLAAIAPLLEPLRATRMEPGGAGADLGPSIERGAAGLGLHHDTTKYFEIHHTRADTFEKVDLRDFNANVAILAVAAYVLADMPGRLVDLADLAAPPAAPQARSFSRR